MELSLIVAIASTLLVVVTAAVVRIANPGWTRTHPIAFVVLTGLSLLTAVNVAISLEDLREFNAFDEVWKKYFPTPPARTTVGTTGLLVKDAMIEIDLIAAIRS